MLLEKEREAVIDSTVAMNKIGVNLNQIAHALNILMDDREKRSIPFKELKLQIAKLSSYIENHLYKTEKILKGAKTRTNIKKEDGRGERIWTSDTCVPNAVLYQAELHPDLKREELVYHKLIQEDCDVGWVVFV